MPLQKCSKRVLKIGFRDHPLVTPTRNRNLVLFKQWFTPLHLPHVSGSFSTIPIMLPAVSIAEMRKLPGNAETCRKCANLA